MQPALCFTFDEVSERQIKCHTENRKNVCGPIADSYIRLALVYSAHPSCSPVFLHSPALNILLWKNPLRRYRPLPLHMLKISLQDHLYNPPFACFSFCPLVCLTHLFTSWTSKSLSFFPFLYLSFLLPPSSWIAPFLIAFLQPQLPLGIFADTEGQPSLHPSIKAANRTCSQPVCWLTSWPPSRPAGQMKSNPARRVQL